MPKRKLTIEEKRFNRIIRKAYKKTGFQQVVKDAEGNRVTKSLSKQQFRHRVQATMDAYDLSPQQAVKKVLNTERFVSAAERSRTNLLKAMRKEFNADYKELVRLNRQIARGPKGQFTSLRANLQWDENLGTYTISGTRNGKPVKYMIVTTNSPKGVSIEEIE